MLQVTGTSVTVNCREYHTYAHLSPIVSIDNIDCRNCFIV